MAFSPDGTLIAGASTSNGTVKLWNVASERLVRSLPTHADDVYSIAFTPDGMTLAAATSNGTIVRWNTETGAPLGKPLRESFQVNAVAYSHDGALLAAGTPTGAVDVINTLTGKSVSRFSVGQPVMQLAFSSGDRDLGVAIPTQVVLRNLSSGRERLLNAGSPRANARSMPQAGVAFSPTQPILATVGDTGNLMLWSSTTGQLLRTEPHDTGGEIVSFSPNGNAILTVESAGEGILWDTKTELALGHAESSEAAQVGATAFSPDGRLLAIGRDDGSLEVSDQRTGEVLWHWHSILPAPQGSDLGVATLAFSPNGHVLVSGDDQAVRLWNARTGQLIRATSTDNDVSQVAFNPDGNLLAAAVNGDRTLLLLDGATGSLVRKLHVGASISGVAWLEGGRLAADSDRGTIILDARSGATTHTIPGDADTTSIASNPDGTILALLNGSGALALWNATTWRQLDSLSADSVPGWPGELAFSQDGRTLATANTNGQAQLWDVDSGQQLGDVFRVPQKTRAPTGVESLAFDPASSSLVMGTSDGTIVTLGPLPLGSVDGTARYLCGSIRRSLTPSEWRQLVPSAPYHATCAPFGYG
jgi:WD40 repeat protein